MADIFEVCLSDKIIEDNILYFPCFKHSEVIALISRYYINMKMHQFSQKHNIEKNKNNMIKKKWLSLQKLRFL